MPDPTKEAEILAKVEELKKELDGRKILIKELAKTAKAVTEEQEAEIARLKKELEEYGPDYVDKLQQRIDELEIRDKMAIDLAKSTKELIGRYKDRISKLEGEMTNSEMEWFQIFESVLGYHPVSKTDALDKGIEIIRAMKEKKVKEDDGYEVRALTPENTASLVMWNDGDKVPPVPNPRIGPIHGYLPDSTGGAEEPGSIGSEGRGEEDQVGDGGESEEDV